jgi:hypothetical protein
MLPRIRVKFLWAQEVQPGRIVQRRCAKRGMSRIVAFVAKAAGAAVLFKDYIAEAAFVRNMALANKYSSLVLRPVYAANFGQ